MAVPATKVERYAAETEDPTRPLLPERAEVILFDLRRELPKVDHEMAGRIHGLMGYIQGRLGRSREALDHLRAADRALPFLAIRTANICAALLSLGHIQEAAREAVGGLKKMSAEPGGEALPLNLNLATALFLLGLVEESEQAFEDAEAGAPHPDAQGAFVLARHAAILGNTPKALRYFARFLRLREGQPIDEASASEIVVSTPWEPSWSAAAPELERVVFAHAAYVNERKRLGEQPATEPGDAEADKAVAEAAQISEEMRSLRARATAAILAEVEGHGPASA